VIRRTFTGVASILFVVAASRILPEFALTLLNYAGLAAIVCVGLVLLTGMAGLVSFGQAAFVGLGAYTSALLTTRTGINPWLTLPCAIVFAAAVAWLLGFLTLRLKGHFLPLGTIAWGLSLYFLFGNLSWLGGQTGLSGLPTLTIAGRPLTSSADMLLVVATLLSVSLLLTRNLLDSRDGRVIRSLNGSAAAAEACGADTTHARVTVFVHAAVLAAVAGWLSAHYLQFVSPATASLNAGIKYVFMIVVGGTGSLAGAVLGAFSFTVLENLLERVVPQLFGIKGDFQIVAFGVLIVLLLQRAPRGLAGLLPERRTAVPAPSLPRGTTALTPIVPTAKVAAGDQQEPGPLLHVTQLQKGFGGLKAVNNLDFFVNRGKILALIGPNGAGKSTTFDLLCGTQRADGGKIILNGERVDGSSSVGMARRGVARTFQHPRLRPEMTVLENVALGAHQRARGGYLRSVLRLNRGEELAISEEVMRQLERVGLAGRVNELAGNLPLGQQRLLEVARALCAAPMLLLLDEPAAGLRLQEKRDLAELVRRLRSQGVTILLIEHDMGFVMSLADHVVVMQYGMKLAEGSPAEMRANALVANAYLGDPT
jgi:ABC-type branched-subunit amino acid transport system ATPase component/ABC-type branched-subunit amino acid transport system permease subunit